MQGPSFFAVIVVSCVLVGAIAGISATITWQKWRSRRFRGLHDIPDLTGQWRCQWFDDVSDPERPKVEDIVEVQKWTGDGAFQALGHQPQFHLSYPITGEIDPSRVVTLVYRAARYPYEPNRGVALMELSRDGRTMEGRWFGRRFSNTFGGGKVKCVRAGESAPSA